MVSKIGLTLSVLAAAEAFSALPSSAHGLTTALHMGLFDGVKDAFGAPALERTAINSERETPIDRWMGWSVVSENDQKEQSAGTCSFVWSSVVLCLCPCAVVLLANTSIFPLQSLSSLG
jgi:hypothetical protein